MSAEIIEVDAQYDVSRPQANPVDAPPNAYVNAGRCDRIAFARRGTGRQRPDSRPGTVETPRGGAIGVISDDAAPHDEPAAPLAIIGCGLPKLLEIGIASSIHTVVWIVLLWSIDLFNTSPIFGGQSFVDTVFAFVFIWVSTFACFYVLVEEDD